ncbi:hypothetical protein EDD21DRAFT_222961 [Dissophora ornata]|nr:hypothetical protein EDD21DRAFT_222961 [Dissophora ornata]
MTVDGTNERPVQAFRIKAPPGSIPASDTVSINTRIDPETEQRIVLWSDIQEVFKGAQGLWNGGCAVSFEIGNDLKKLDPLRISHHPGVILEVVVESPGHDKQSIPDNLIPSLPPFPHALTSNTATSLNIKTSAQKSNELVTNLSADIAGVHAITQQAASLSFASTENTHQSLSVYSGNLNPEARESLQAYNQLHGSYFKAIISGQETQATIIMRSTEQHFRQLQEEMDKNRGLLQQIHELQESTRLEVLTKHNEMLQQQEAMRQELLKKEQQILDIQKQTLDRLSIIQSRVQALLIQTYELHEYPIPRLFIVLPKAMRFRDRLENPFSDQFRLYFLCECGEHTMSKDSRGHHEIHLAKHKGYDINRPTEFFQKYGPYVLAMMQMIQYGVVVAGIVVPPLAHFKLVESIEGAKKVLDVAKQNITPLIDETITYIKSQSNKPDVDFESSTTATELDRLEVLEGADLRQLESFLKIKDGGRVLGNLYRIVTLGGHVKWVCIDHYRENYREAAVQRLREVVDANSGTFLEEMGSIEIGISSRIQAKEFYEALVEARGIRVLDIELRWDVTLDDLRKFSNVITMANILGLTVDGKYFEGPTFDVINRGRRYDPLIQLMFNGRLKTLRFKESPRFLSHVSTSFIMKASQLQVLEIEIRMDDKEADVRRVMPRILDGCHSLIHLTLHVNDMWLSLSLDLAIKKLGKMKRLETLTVMGTPNEEGEVAVMRASEGRIETVEARYPSLKQIKKWGQEFIGKGLLTKVAVGINYGEEALLPDFLRRNPLISHFQIECVDASVPAVIETVTSAQIAVLENGNESALQKLEVVAMDSWLKIPYITSTVEFQGKDKTPIMSINIEKFGGKYYRGSDHLNMIFSRYGSSLEKLKVERTSDRHVQLLDNATKENGSRLILLELDLTLLTRVGLKSMDRVIERSHSLRKLGLHLDVDDRSQLEKAEHLFDRHCNRLTALYLTGNSDEDWIPKIKQLCPMRHRLPELSDFRLDYRPNIPSPSLAWICTMISPPPQRSDPMLSPQLSMQDGSSIPPHESAPVGTRTWKSLARIQLMGLFLQPDNWRRVIEAIDFSALEFLSFNDSNFGLDELKMLVDRISDISDFKVPLVTLGLLSTPVWQNRGNDDVCEQWKRLKMMIPLVHTELD